MSKQFHNTQYPSIVGSPMGWWHKPLNPYLSIIILILAILFVFILGTWFADQYIKIWSQVKIQAASIPQESSYILMRG